jgi:CheY-like chemotaxis protein
MLAATEARAASKILVVDDDCEIREALTEVLMGEGYCVANARNGWCALESIHLDRPDLIVLDLMMPVMNGLQFLEARASDRELASIPVVTATAGSAFDVEGATVCLQKPFDIHLLLATVALLCGREARRGESSPLEAPGQSSP